MKEIVDTLTYKGYEKSGYGYKKVTENNTHWVTLFEKDGLIQMYAYFTEDEEFEKIYDTGMIENVTEGQLKVLIEVLVNNHL